MKPKGILMSYNKTTFAQFPTVYLIWPYIKHNASFLYNKYTGTSPPAILFILESLSLMTWNQISSDMLIFLLIFFYMQNFFTIWHEFFIEIWVHEWRCVNRGRGVGYVNVLHASAWQCGNMMNTELHVHAWLCICLYRMCKNMYVYMSKWICTTSFTILCLCVYRSCMRTHTHARAYTNTHTHTLSICMCVYHLLYSDEACMHVYVYGYIIYNTFSSYINLFVPMGMDNVYAYITSACSSYWILVSLQEKNNSQVRIETTFKIKIYISTECSSGC